MQKILLCFLLSCALLFCFSQHNNDKNWPEQLKQYKAAEKIYNKAWLLSDNAGEDSLLLAKADSSILLALNEFTRLLPSVENTGNDSMQFFIRMKRGYIYYYFDSIELAKKDYLAAINLKKNLPSIADSFSFLPHLFTGTIYYGQNQFDSALYFFKNAEKIVDEYPQKLSESQRLYNMSGVMYYETGNYRQARNYFEKAILLTERQDSAMVKNYKINIAALLVKLESFDEAKKIYTELLRSPSFENEIYHNLAIIALKEQQFTTAIDYLRKVNYSDKKIIDLYYNFGAAYAGLNDNDSVEFYLQKALAENLKWNGHSKNTQYGLILKYEADELAKQQLYKEAVEGYQKSIRQFVADYDGTDPYQNPIQFSSAFSYINLFNTLAAKAAAFENWYQQEKNIKLLDAALNAYRAAFNLASYVEKTYDSDEARLFLGKIKYSVHGKPIDISLQLYDLTQKKRYLEEAYLFDQENKASALAFNIQEQELRFNGKNENDLFNQESEIKSFITRLSLRAVQLNDSVEIAGIVSTIRDKEIALSRIREKLKDDPEWKEKMESERIPSVNQMQKKLDHTTALVSYHLTENELLILLITQSRFEYYKSAINKNFYNAIENFKTSLHQAGGDQHYNGTVMANRLYEKLISPVYDKLIQIKRLVIIPDDELHYLPFEALQDENKKYLLERFSIQYQYSTALLDRNSKKLKGNSTLSLAPFANWSFKDSSGNNFSSLPYSGQEISGLPGASFTDSAATKTNFLKRVDTYRIFHLATHAKADNINPSRSFISFYPGDDNSKLYASEIANLRLDSTQLVILSACETGAGQLVKGEGLMSLSRAFAYAGCPDIITSLWKAEDRTTAFLTKQLHYYLEKNYTKDKALQQAKLDLLASDKIDPRFKSPVYWAHLVFIGNYESRQNPAHWWWIAFVFIGGAIIYKIIGKKKEEAVDIH